MTRAILKKITHPFLKYAGGKFSSKPQPYSYKGITVTVMPEVFPPHYTFSTKILLDYVNELDLKAKTVLELGCGCGIISLFAASKKATVTASDINTVALEALETATLKNNLDVEIINSNLFDKIKNQSLDYVIINPPYYPKVPKNVKEQAWFCGKNFEYFKILFAQLSNREDKTVLMILSQDCDINTIKDIASQNQLQLTIEQKRSYLIEKSYIFIVHKY